MAFVGLDGHWLRINSALRQIVGYSEEDLLATNSRAITHPDDLAADLNYVRQMLRREIRSYQMENVISQKGTCALVLLSVTWRAMPIQSSLLLFPSPGHHERKRGRRGLARNRRAIPGVLE